MSNNGNRYRRARAGDPLRIPAETYNSMLSLLSSGALVVDGGPAGATSNSTRVAIKNNTGANRDRYCIYGVSGPLFAPNATNPGEQAAFEREIVIAGVTPTASHAGAFVVALEPISAGGIGVGVLAGAVHARVVMASESDRYADVKVNDSQLLQSASSGIAQLLWIQPAAQRGSQGYAWCIIRIGGGGGSSAGTTVRTGIVSGYVAGPRGGVNSAFTCRDMDASGNPTGTSYTVYAISHGDNVADWGTQRLDQCIPHKRVGDPLKFVEMDFLGATRRVAVAEFQLAGCGL